MPERERYVAGYVDRLPDGAAMDVKSLARALPLYGQMAVGTALRALGVAGHLRRVRCQVVESGQGRWITRTFWSRTARDSEWWDTFIRTGGETRSDQAAPAEAGPMQASPRPADPTPASEGPLPPVPQQRSAAGEPSDRPSPAYLALARIGRSEPRLALSSADCAALEALASAWLDRGVSVDHLAQALTAGLPAQVGSPVGLVRRRLIDKIPPRMPDTAPEHGPDKPARRILVECTECGAPGPPEALPDGLCASCRTPAQDVTSTAPAGAPLERDVHTLVGSLRNLMRTP